VKIFLSYSSARRDVAVRLKLALEAEQHDVFFDRDDLGAGEAYHQAIRQAVQAADLMVFLVSPESVAAGSYTLAELRLAEARWRRPAGHVLPVVVAATPKATIPPYLMAVTLLEPQGEPVAETVAAVAALAAVAQPPNHRTWWFAAAALAALLLAGGGYAWQRQQALDRGARAQAEQQAAEQAAERAALATAAGRALRLCTEGSHAEGFAQLQRLAQAAPVARTALEDCAMAWLREPRAARSEKTYAQFVAPLRALLTQALVSGASGPRAADLRAHLGWSDVLVWEDTRSPGIDPVVHYRQALQDDPDNTYAHALWAHWLLKKPPHNLAAARGHFEAALRTARDRSFVRKLQVGITVGDESTGAYALQALDQMRQGGESNHMLDVDAVWSFLYATAYRTDTAERLRNSLPAAQGLQTFLWLFPPGSAQGAGQPVWRYIHALMLHQAGRGAEARADLSALQRQFKADRVTGSLPDAVNRLLSQLP
jgi:TIR domain